MAVPGAQLGTSAAFAETCICCWDSNNLGPELRDRQGRRCYLVAEECPVHGLKAWPGGETDDSAWAEVEDEVTEIKKVLDMLDKPRDRADRHDEGEDYEILCAAVEQAVDSLPTIHGNLGQTVDENATGH